MCKRGWLILGGAAVLCAPAWVYGTEGIQGDLYEYSTGKSSSSGSGMGDTSSGFYRGWDTLPGRTGLVNSVSMSSASPDTTQRSASGTNRAVRRRSANAGSTPSSVQEDRAR